MAKKMMESWCQKDFPQKPYFIVFPHLFTFLQLANELILETQTPFLQSCPFSEHLLFFFLKDKCSGLVHWEDPEGSGREGGGMGMGNTCKSMADSCQCMTKTTIIL